MKANLPGHPKLKALRRRLGVSIPTAIGHLELLWAATAQYATGGDVGRFDDDDIEEFVGWEGEPGAFVAACIEAGFLVRCTAHRLVVHDWPEHCPEYVRKRMTRSNEQFATPEPPPEPASDGQKGDRRTTADAVRTTSATVRTTADNVCPGREVKSRQAKPSQASSAATSAAAESQQAARSPSIAWTRDEGWTGITEADRAAWRDAYPACDLDLELARAGEWLKANPTKARKSNWRKFVVNWLTRSQDKGGTRGTGPPATAAPRERQYAHRYEDL